MNPLRFAKGLSSWDKSQKSYHLICIATYRNNVWIGTNKLRQYNRHLSAWKADASHEFHNGLHAEADCIRQIPSNVPTHKVKFLILRFSRTNTFALAKPCVSCQALFAHHGFKTSNIKYSNNMGLIETLTS